MAIGALYKHKKSGVGLRNFSKEQQTTMINSQYGFCFTRLRTTGLLAMTGFVATGSGNKLLFCCSLSHYQANGKQNTLLSHIYISSNINF